MKKAKVKSKPSVHIEKISRFKVATRNANKHTDRGLQMLGTAMQKNGYVAPLTVARDGEAIDGSARLGKAGLLGEDAIVIEHDGSKPIIAVRTDIPNAHTAKAKRIALEANRVAQVDLDYDVDILADLAANDADALAGLFDERELRDLLGDKMPGGKEETADAEELIDKAAELQAKWQVQRGDVWQVGRHRVMCGDSTNAADVARLGITSNMPVFTDPPYGIDYDPRFLAEIAARHNKRLSSTDKVKNDDGSLDLSFLWQCERRMVWGFPYIKSGDESGWVVWDKQPGVESRGIVTPIEMASTTMRKGFDVVRVMWGGFYRAAGEKQMPHPTQKPVGVYKPFIEQWTKPDEIIADYFLGCAPVLVACEQTGRIGRGMEIEPKYVAVTLERLTALGLQPKRVTDTNGNGKTKATA